MQYSSGFINLISELKKSVHEVNVSTVKELIDYNSSKNLILIDIRETEEWDEGYIKQAIHISKGIIERDIEKVVPNKSTEVILYCRGGMRSIITADLLQKMGYRNVRSMAGGICAWQEANYDIEID